MTTDTPAAAPITAEREAREAFERHIGNQNPKRLLFKRGGSVFAEDVPEEDYVDGGIQRRWTAWKAAWLAALSAPVAAQPAVSGVDALWVDTKLMELAKVSFVAGIAHGHGAKNDWSTDGKAFAIIDSVRTHLSTGATK